MKKVLVTGADGFIGSHLVENLIKRGYDVKALCIYNSNGSYGWLDTIDNEIKKSVEFILGDIRDPISVKNALCDSEIVFHLAALISIPYSYKAPSSYIDTNIHGTLNILQAAKELDKKVDEKLHEAQPNVEMKGFRKGKVPMAMLKKQFGSKVLGEAMQETVDGAMNEHFEKFKIKAKEDDCKSIRKRG